MSVAAPATAAIEAAIRREQEHLERVIARWRVVLFAAFTAMSGVILAIAWLTFPRELLRYNAFPVFYYGGATLYGLAARAFVSRAGARPGVVIATLVIDLLAANGVMWIYWNIHMPENIAFGAMTTREMMWLWASFLVAPSLVLVLAVNSLRQSPRLDAIGGLAAMGVFVAMTARVPDVWPQRIAVMGIMGMLALVFAARARRTRRLLLDSAREQLLRRYLAPAAVERVLADPDSALAPGGRHAEVTLVSTDLRGFTSMSEKLSPEETIAQLNAYHETMLRVIERHGGMLDKFIGDGALVVFGLPIAGAAPAADAGACAALACAREMLEALAAHNAERAARQQPPLAMGVGVHTGPVIAGNLGAGARLEFTVIGDAVNTASRIEGLTKELGSPLLVSAETIARASTTDGLREIGPVPIRGRAEALRVFALARAA